MFRVNNQHFGDNRAKKTAFLVIGVLMVMLVMSIIYYKERVLFADAPHIMSLIINDRSLHIEEMRYGAFITQMFPYLGSIMHLPFKILMVLYSMSFTLFYLGIALLIIYRFRQYRFAILLGLYLTLFSSQSYYWTNNEVHQGIAWLMLAFACTWTMAEKKSSFALSTLVFTILFSLAIYTHPLVLTVALFLWFFNMLDKDNWPFSKNQSIIYTIILLIVCFLKYHHGANHGYDSGKIEQVTLFKPDKLKTICSWHFSRFFFSECISNYWTAILLFVAGIAALLQKKKYLLALFSIGGAMLFLLLVAITFQDADSNKYYLESEYMSLGIICCAPFVYYLLPQLKSNYLMAVMAFIFCVRLAYIQHSASVFTNRVRVLCNMNEKMRQKGLTKIIITNPDNAVDKILLMTWGAPLESIFVSHLSGEKPQRTFIFQNPDEMKLFDPGKKNELLECFTKRNVSRINSYYFCIDTNKPYQIIDYKTLME